MTVVIIVALMLLWYFINRLLDQVAAERDEAKREAKVYRNLLFPVMAKAESVTSPDVTPVTNVTAKQTPRKSPFLDRRVPFRLRFKAATRATNKKQQGTDALAAALAKQPTGEKANA